MKIQKQTIDDSKIHHAHGKWVRGAYCSITIILFDKRRRPLTFVTYEPSEIDSMRELLEDAISISLKNCGRNSPLWGIL
jgi:hypothetical protein